MKQLITTSIAAPGFYGLNTQESSVTLASGYALEATNCVIDSHGGLGARNGWVYRTTDDTTVNLEGMHEFINNSGVSTYISWGGNKIYSGYTTLTEFPAVVNGGVTYTPTANNWQAVTLSDHMFMFQRDHHPLVQEAGGALERIEDHAHSRGTPPQANCVLSAYGRLWVADIVGDSHTVYWSDLVISTGAGGKWSGGTTGSLDIATSFTKGGDSIVALAAFNGFLIILCKDSIVIYGDSDTSNNQSYLVPSDLRLVEVIEGIGCVSRDSVQHTGTDLLFLSKQGVSSLTRLIQEKSAPIGDISINVRDELTALIASENHEDIKTVYSSLHAFYLVSFPLSQQIYCFDTRGRLENGASRATHWRGLTLKGMIENSDSKVLMAQPKGIGEYTEYLDNGSTYNMSYYTNHFDFDQPTTVKMLKSIGISLIGGSGQSFSIKAGTDYSTQYRSYTAFTKQTVISEYDISTYGPSSSVTPYLVSWDAGGVAPDNWSAGSANSVAGTGEYSGGGGSDRVKLSIGGSGSVIQLGFETEISGDEVSIQKFDLYIKQGRTI